MNTFLFVVEIIGVIAYSVSGAMVAIDREADLFGVLFLSLITTFGGGIIRDLLLGNILPVFFSLYIEIIVCTATSLCVFIAAAVWKNHYLVHEELIARIDNIVDALGLGVFAVYGCRIAMATEGATPFLVIFMGMTTCVGGGVIRDLLLRDIPFVLRKRIYALAAIAGSAVYYLIVRFVGTEVLAVLAGIATVFLLRLLATLFRWNLPRAIRFDPK